MSENAAVRYIKKLENEFVMPGMRTQMDFSILLNDESVSAEDRKAFFCEFYETIPSIDFPSIENKQKHMQTQAIIALVESNIPDIREYEDEALQRALQLLALNQNTNHSAKIVSSLLNRKTITERQELISSIPSIIKDLEHYPTFVQQTKDYFYNPKTNADEYSETKNKARQKLMGIFSNNMSEKPFDNRANPSLEL